MAKVCDLTGAEFGRLKVISRAPDTIWGTQKKKVWLCDCICGKRLQVAAQSLKSGNTVSCGCYHAERQVEVKTTHGMSRSPTYKSWRHMLDRCTNPTDRLYPKYSKFGMDPEFKDFEIFLAYMGDRPKGTTLDRWPDQNKGYFRGNMRWATPKQQARNMTTNRLVTFQNKTQTLIEWCEQLDLDYYAVSERINGKGLPPHVAISTPTPKGYKPFNAVLRMYK